MFKLITLIFISMLIVSGSVIAEGCANAESATAITDYHVERYEAADKELNAVYQEAMKLLSDDEKKVLIKAQKAWLKYRDASFAFAMETNKDASSNCIANYKTLFVEKRVLDLKSILSDSKDKCLADGKTVNQNATCPHANTAETSPPITQKPEDIEAIHKELDRLQATGIGMLPEDNSAFRASSSIEINKEYFVPTHLPPIASILPKIKKKKIPNNQFETLDLTEAERNTIQSNAKSAATLTAGLDAVKQACGGKLFNGPEVGMTDENFIYCTISSHVNYINQIVMGKHGTTPIKLYVSPFNGPKIYLINGVITAVKR